MGNYLKQIYKISSANYQTLKETGSLTYNGKTYKYDPNNLYLIENNLTDDYVLTGGGGSKLISELSVKHASTADSAETAAKANEASEAWHAKSVRNRTTTSSVDAPVWHSLSDNTSSSLYNMLDFDTSFTYNPSTDTLKVPNIEGTITEAKHATSSDTATKVTNKLTAGTKTYDGSNAVSLTKADLGLGNVDNTSDAEKSVKSAKYDVNGYEFTSQYVNKNTYIIPNETLDCPKPYISKIDNGLAAANKWAIVSITGTYSGYIANLFDGNYDAAVSLKGNNTITINIKFNEAGTQLYAGYPYGVFYTMWYYGGTPSEISCRVYCNYEPQTIGWHPLNKQFIERNIIGFRNNYYAISQIEFTITGNGIDEYENGKYNTMLTQIEYRLDRPSLSQPHPILYKYKDETLYYPLTVPELIEGSTTLSQKYAPKSIETTVNNKVDKVSGKQLSTNDYTDDEKNKLAGLSNAEALTNSEIDTIFN